VSRSPLKGPLGGLLALCALALVAALLLGALKGSHKTAAVNPSAPLVLNPAPRTATTAVQEPSLEAQRVARRFLGSYLPVLYGRRPARTIVDTDQHVHASLVSASHTPPAPRRSHPRVTGLAASRQSDGSVLEIATINDRASPVYRIVFTVAKQDGAWRVTQLANY
jgi:hypothetical protein